MQIIEPGGHRFPCSDGTGGTGRQLERRPPELGAARGIGEDMAGFRGHEWRGRNCFGGSGWNFAIGFGFPFYRGFYPGH